MSILNDDNWALFADRIHFFPLDGQLESIEESPCRPGKDQLFLQQEVRMNFGHFNLVKCLDIRVNNYEFVKLNA